jgi:hypothetical protein
MTPSVVGLSDSLVQSLPAEHACHALDGVQLTVHGIGFDTVLQVPG